MDQDRAGCPGITIVRRELILNRGCMGLGVLDMGMGMGRGRCGVVTDKVRDKDRLGPDGEVGEAGMGDMVGVATDR